MAFGRVSPSRVEKRNGLGTKTRMTKVLVVSRRLDIGGTEVHLTRVLPRLRQRGIDVSLFLLDRGGTLEAELANKNISIFGPTVSTRSFFQRLLNTWRLYRHLRRHRPDVVHFFLPEPYLLGSFAAMLAGVKLRVMNRRSLANYQARHPTLKSLEVWLHRRTLVLLGNSQAVVAELARESTDRQKIGLIYSGIDIPAPISPERRAELRRTLNLPPDSFVMTIVANLIGYKGHDDLLQALILLGDRLPANWHLLVVGRDDGPGAALKKKAADAGLGEHIRWLGE